MNKQEIIDNLNLFKTRLTDEVLQAFYSRGREFGKERFNAWRRKFTRFLDENLPSETSVLNDKLTHYASMARRGESAAQRFLREDGNTMLAYIDSLILDVENDEYDIRETKYEEKNNFEVIPNDKPKTKIFIVHGHDGEAKQSTARFIEKLGFEAIILHEQASKGMTIIEKIENYSNDVGFGIVLYTPDDMGNTRREAEKGDLKSRARQNVVFEHGFLIGKIGRKNVIPLVEGAIELPNDISGIVYINDKEWQIDIAKEMKSAGYNIDFNKLL